MTLKKRVAKTKKRVAKTILIANLFECSIIQLFNPRVSRMN